MTFDHRYIALGLIALGGAIAALHLAATREPDAPAASGAPEKVATPPQAAAQPAAPPAASRAEPGTTAADAAATLAGSDSAAGTGATQTGAPPLAPGAAAVPSTAAPAEAKALAGAERAAAPEVRPVSGKVGGAGLAEAPFTHFHVGNRNVKRILVDGNHIWVGTTGGLIRYHADSDEYRLYDARSGLPVNNVAFVGKLGTRVVAGTQGGGLAVLDADGKKWNTYGKAEGLGDGNVHQALRATNGDVWIATSAGANRVRGGALGQRAQWDLYTSATTQRGLPSDRVYGLAEGKNGDIWLATEGGVALFRKGAWRHWNHAAGVGAAAAAAGADQRDVKSDAHAKAAAGGHSAPGGSASFVVAIAVDAKGIVWAGTLGGGLARFDGTAWRNFTVAEGLPGNFVFALHRDSKDRVWIGTNGGLARELDGAFRVLTTQDGLFGNAVYAVASAPRNLWVGSYGGVARIRALN